MACQTIANRNSTSIPLFRRILLAWLFSIVASSAFAGDTQDERYKAAVRYLETTPVSKMLDEALVEIAKQLPVDQRDEIISRTKELIDVPLLEKTMLDGLVKVFTTEEINALADFYGSDVGKRVMAKFGVYMGETMPIMQREIIKSAKIALAQNEDN